MSDVRKPAFQKLPYLHFKVNISHLHKENKKLVTEDEIKWVKNKFKDKPDGRISRKTVKEVTGIDVPITWDIVKMKGRWFAVYLGDPRPEGDPLKGEKGKAIKGGMARFRVMQDLDSGKIYGLKIRDPKEELAHEEKAQADYTSERSILELVNKTIPDTVTGFPIFGKEGVPGQQNIATDLEPGFEFFQVLEKFPLSPVRALDAVIQLFEQLQFLHEQLGVLHNDIKTENAMMDTVKGIARLTDFGLADKMDDRGEAVSGVKGTPACMAPEILAAYEADPSQPVTYSRKTDAYSAGVLLEDTVNHTWSHSNSSLREIINDLKAINPGDRKEVNAALIERLKAERAVIAAENPIRIGVLSIEEFENSDEAYKKILLDELKKYNEIMLVLNEDSEIDDKRLIEIRRTFENNHLILREKVLLNPSEDELRNELKNIEKSEQILVSAVKISLDENLELKKEVIHRSPLFMAQLTVTMRDVLKTELYDYYVQNKNDLLFQSNLAKIKNRLEEGLQALSEPEGNVDEEERKEAEKFIKSSLQALEENPEQFKDTNHPIYKKLEIDLSLDGDDPFYLGVQKATHCASLVFAAWAEINNSSFRKNINSPQELAEKLEARLAKLMVVLKTTDKEQAEFYDAFFEGQKKYLAACLPEIDQQLIEEDEIKKFKNEAQLMQMRMTKLMKGVEYDAHHNPAAKEILSECHDIAERFNQLVEDYEENKNNLMPYFHERLANIKNEFDDFVEAMYKQEKHRVQHRPSPGFFKDSPILDKLHDAMPTSTQVELMRKQLESLTLAAQSDLSKIPLEKPAVVTKYSAHL